MIITEKRYKNLMKFFYKATHSKKYYHNRKFWHLFSVARNKNNAITRIKYKGKNIKINEKIKENKSSEKLVIVATGPSILDIDNTFFENDNYDFMGVNGAISLQNANFTYYCIFDPRFITFRIELVKRIVSNARLVLFCDYNVLANILELLPFDEVKCSFKVIEFTTEGQPIQRFLRKEEALSKSYTHDFFPLANNFGFSTNIDDFVFDYGTVTYIAMQIACHLEYKSIYIVGFDMNNFTEPRFYETKLDKLETGLGKRLIKVQNACDAAAKYCNTQGITVLNLSPTSSITSFKKTSFKNII